MNFGAFRNPSGVETNVPSSGILNLNKGGILDLNKREPLLKNVVIAAKWVFTKSNYSDLVDMDIAAFLLDKNRKITNPQTQVVFFNQRQQQGIYIDKDNRTGAKSEEDDDCEKIYVNLNEIPADCHSIVFTINIFDCMKLKQTFGMVDSAKISLLNAENNEELSRFELRENASNATAVIFAELFRTDGGWSFKAVGEPIVVASLDQILMQYM